MVERPEGGSGPGARPVPRGGTRRRRLSLRHDGREGNDDPVDRPAAYRGPRAVLPRLLVLAGPPRTARDGLRRRAVLGDPRKQGPGGAGAADGGRHREPGRLVLAARRAAVPRRGGHPPPPPRPTTAG